MPLIRDTMDPTREREVSRSEQLDLERMGALFDSSKTRAKTDEGLRAAAVRQVLDRVTPPASEEPPSEEPAQVEDAEPDPKTPGDAPDSNTPDTDDTQES